MTVYVTNLHAHTLTCHLSPLYRSSRYPPGEARATEAEEQRDRGETLKGESAGGGADSTRAQRSALSHSAA